MEHNFNAIVYGVEKLASTNRSQNRVVPIVNLNETKKNLAHDNIWMIVNVTYDIMRGNGRQPIPLQCV